MLKQVAKKLLGVDPADPSSGRRIRSIYRDLRFKIRGPEWVRCPNNIQIDTHNFCNLWQRGKGCIHCNVKPSGGWGLKRAFMPDEMIQYIIEYWGNKGSKSIAPYVNGEPLLDSRLPWICDLTQQNKMHVEIDTNGTLFDNRKMLVHPAMKQVRFTFSALTPETYQIVHGADLFREVSSTVDWFLKNAGPGQYPMLYFITNKHNVEELFPYIKKWRGRLHITVFPLHEVGDIQEKSLENRFEHHSWSEITKKITGSYPTQENRCIDIYPDGTAEVRYFLVPYEVCQGSHSFSVSCHGDLLHCTDIPYSFNYGNIYERDMLTVWHERNKNKINHPACNVCNVKHPDHDQILRKWIK